MSGTKKVWTTFSADQIDLNYRNPDVLLEIIETLLLRARAAHPAFDPYGETRVLDLHPAVFAVMRGDAALCLHNVSAQRVELGGVGARPLVDLLTRQRVGSTATLAPYQTMWLTTI